MIETQCLTDADGLFVTDARGNLVPSNTAPAGTGRPDAQAGRGLCRRLRMRLLQASGRWAGVNDMAAADVDAYLSALGRDLHQQIKVKLTISRDGTPIERVLASMGIRRCRPRTGLPRRKRRLEYCPAGGECGYVRPVAAAALNGIGLPTTARERLVAASRAEEASMFVYLQGNNTKGIPANHYVLINPGEHLGTSKVLAAWTEKTPMGEVSRAKRFRSLRQWPCGR